MNNRYIELYSAHRNRLQWKNPSLFVTPFWKTASIQDPIMTGAIYYTWTSDYSPSFLPLKSGSTNYSPKLCVSNITPQPSLPYYYSGYTMLITVGSVSESRIVTSYDPNDVSVSLNTAFDFAGHDVQNGDLYALFEMNTPSLIHLPLTDIYYNPVSEMPEAYYGYYVMDETLSYGTRIVGRQIVDYDSELRYCHLEEPFPIDWALTDSYTLRKTLPFEKWTLAAPTATEDGYIVFTLPVGRSTSDTLYVNKYIYRTTNNDHTLDNYQFKPIYGSYRIVKYDPITGQVFCNNDLTYEGGPPTLGDTINIVIFENDNSSQLSYTGSIVSQSQTVCYEISIISLILPNVTLTTGSRIAFYPYVYVLFENTSVPSGAAHDLIYSNNPKSGNALFIVHVTDVVQPVNGRFVKLVGRMRQTVKFKPNDSLRFSVYLPDGTLFLPVKQDLLSPYDPDPALQIDAVFSIRRL
uniref:Uncharacterized protein n=1 Tax=viral metagenome TaxID=1070528 RepID=A0A6C0KFD8_9ZZZZ